MARRTLQVLLAAGALLGLLAGCAPKPVKLEVEPSNLVFTSAGDAAILITHLSDSSGATVVKHEPCAFATSDALVADVRPDGTVRANGGGRGAIRVQCGSLVAQVPFRVSLPASVIMESWCEARCTRVTEDPLALKLVGAGASAKLSARVTDEAGEQVAVEPRWEAVDPDYRTGARPTGLEITKDGELHTDGTLGKFLILATAGNAVARGSVEVTLPKVDAIQAQPRVWLAPNTTAQLQPRAFQRTARLGLKPIAGARFTYTSNNPTVVKVGDGGKLTAVSMGTTEVDIAAENGDAFTTVVVMVSEDNPFALPPAPSKALPKLKKRTPPPAGP